VSTEGSLNTITDQIEINFKMLSQNLKSKIIPFKELNISLGDSRFFYDENANQVWLPEQAYKPGSWGYLGGKIFAMEKSVRQSFGSDKNIFETDLDPIFETQRVGIEQFKFDVPSGDYELILHFAELLSEDKKEELIYNLSNGKSKDEFLNREFSVSLNGNESFLRLNNQQNLIPERAFSTKLNISLTDEKGISVDFKAFQSLPILNGIQLKKIR
jgi:beta-galactosidase